MTEQTNTQPPLSSQRDATRLKLARVASLTAAVAIMAGAFGAHGVSGEPKRWLMTGGHYQLMHAIAALVALRWSERLTSSALLLTGAWIFAGSLYAMALGAPRALGAITPIGGLIMIIAWVTLAFTLRLRSSVEG